MTLVHIALAVWMLLLFVVWSLCRASARAQEQPNSEPDDGSWPWCEACNSWHHPRNPTCKKLRAKLTTYNCECGQCYLVEGQVIAVERKSGYAAAQRR